MFKKPWLCHNIKMYEQITTLRETSYKLLLKTTAIILVIATALAFGINIGRSYTIRQAELLETTNDTYFISFGDEVHEYTFKRGLK